MNTSIQAPVSFTINALKEITRLINEEGFDRSKYLRVGVKGGGCSGMTYILGFDDRNEKDALYEVNGLTFIIQPSHELYLSGMEIDWQGGLNARGFSFSNPNASKTCGCGTSFAV